MSHLISFWLLLGVPQTQPLQRFAFEQPCMGTLARIVVYAPDSVKAKQASDVAFQRMQTLNRIMSDYQDDSELMQLCHKPFGKAYTISNDLFFVIEKSQAVAEASNGVFDITVGPLTKLWRRARRQHKPPSPHEIETAQKHVDFRSLQLHPDKQQLTLLKDGMLLDLGGIAKGYAADQAFKCLKDQQLPRALVVLGGEVVAGDPPPGQTGWVIQIPSVPNQLARKQPSILIANRAVSTSGDQEQFLDWQGKRFSHIIDPRTGYGRIESPTVTVVAQSGMEADAWATTFSLLSLDQTKQLLTVLPQVDVRHISQQNQVPTEWHSEGWKRWTDVK